MDVEDLFMIYQMEKDANHALIEKINHQKLLEYRQDLKYKYLQKNLRQNQ